MTPQVTLLDRGNNHTAVASIYPNSAVELQQTLSGSKTAMTLWADEMNQLATAYHAGKAFELSLRSTPSSTLVARSSGAAAVALVQMVYHDTDLLYSQCLILTNGELGKLVAAWEASKQEAA